MRAAAGSRHRSRQTRRSSTNDQYIGMGVARLIAIRVAFVLRPAQPCRTAYEGLVEHPRPASWPHESLVVEPGAQERRKGTQHCLEIEIDRGPGILPTDNQPCAQFGYGCWHIGRSAIATSQCHESVGLLDPRGEEAARTVILETAPDQRDTIREQRRGQRITTETGELAPLEDELQRHAALQTAASGQSARGGTHVSAPSRASCARPTSLVAVLRSSTSHCRQPCTCCQYSRCGPLGLSNTNT